MIEKKRLEQRFLLLSFLLVIILLPVSCVGGGQQRVPENLTLQGLTSEEVAKVIDIALNSTEFAKGKEDYDDNYRIVTLAWVFLDKDTLTGSSWLFSADVSQLSLAKEAEEARKKGLTDMVPGLIIYFGKDIEKEGGWELSLAVDLEEEKVIMSIWFPLKSRPPD
jgi:hypothetical protein